MNGFKNDNLNEFFKSKLIAFFKNEILKNNYYGSKSKIYYLNERFRTSTK